MGRKRLAPGELVQLDDEGAAGNDPTQLLHQLSACRCGTAGGDEIVHQQNALSGKFGRRYADVYIQNLTVFFDLFDLIDPLIDAVSDAKGD